MHLRTEQWGRSFYRSSARNRHSTSSGDTSDHFESSVGGRSYRRSVRAVNGSIVSVAQT
ncbi:uncharacterized protein BJX67DRAFT_360872 [Aspergillus lucknowensis]|uniref:Uncharacterized protein n=1 Tax=Aspergillus lucknowensis TaxID=176173 RepID=A0ABR4LKC6_9EURO